MVGAAFSTWKYKIVIDCNNCNFWTPNSSSLTIPCKKTLFNPWDLSSGKPNRLDFIIAPPIPISINNHLKICDVAKTMFFWVAKFHYFCDFSRRKTWETIWKSEKWVFSNKQFAILKPNYKFAILKSHIWGEKTLRQIGILHKKV
jgi:hypothetical protein